MGTRLSEDELQHALDFCVHLFSPTTPEQHEAVKKRLQTCGSFEGSWTTPSGRQEAVAGKNRDGLGLLDVSAPIINPAKLNKFLSRHLQHSTSSPDISSTRQDQHAEESEVKMVLEKVNARRVIHAEHGNGLNSLEEEAVEGLVVRLQRGRLGLTRTI